MSISKLATVVIKLRDATRRGKVEWEQTEKEGVFQASYPDFTIRIFTQLTRDPEPDVDIDYVISIYNSKGVLIESATDIDLKPTMELPFKVMEELYDSARGYALGLEQTLDSIIETLSDEDLPF